MGTCETCVCDKMGAWGMRETHQSVCVCVCVCVCVMREQEREKETERHARNTERSNDETVE